MSLDANTWINRDQLKVSNDSKQLYTNENHQQARGVLKIPVKQFILPAESINRYYL